MSRREPTVRTIDRRGLRPRWSQTLSAASLVPMVVVPFIVLLALLEGSTGTSVFFDSPRSAGVGPNLDAATLFGTTAIGAVWLALALRHLTIGGFSRRCVAALAGGGLGLLTCVLGDVLNLWSGVGEASLIAFPLLFGLRNTSWLTHPLRPGRVRVAAILMTATVALLVAPVAGWPGMALTLWATVVAAATQIVAPYRDDDREPARVPHSPRPMKERSSNPGPVPTSPEEVTA